MCGIFLFIFFNNTAVKVRALDGLCYSGVLLDCDVAVIVLWDHHVMDTLDLASICCSVHRLVVGVCYSYSGVTMGLRTPSDLEVVSGKLPHNLGPDMR